MGAAQFDLFSPPAGPPPTPASPTSLFERMSEPVRENAVAQIDAAPIVSEGQLAWVRKIIPVWTKRARLLREGKPTPEQGADWRADVLERIVERLALKAAGGDRIAALKLRLDACQPYAHPTAIGIVCHSGPIMAEVRAELEAAIAYAEAHG